MTQTIEIVTLSDFISAYGEDDNIWWRMACGEHQNVVEALLDERETYEARYEHIARAWVGQTLALATLRRELRSRGLGDVYDAAVASAQAKSRSTLDL